MNRPRALSVILVAGTLLGHSFGATAQDLEAPQKQQDSDGAAVPAQWVIPPGAEVGLRRALDGDGKVMSGGWKWISAEVNNAQVQVRFEGRSGAAMVTLVRHNVASGDAVSVPGQTELAIEPRPGPAPASFVKALAQRLGASGFQIPWKRVGDGAADAPVPDPVPPAAAADAEQTDDADEGARVMALGKRIEHLLQRGNPDGARALLSEIKVADVQSPASRAELAVLHGLVGDVAGARAIAEGLAGTRAELLARAAADPSQITPALLKDATPEASCRMVVVGHALNRLGKAVEAEGFLRAIVQMSPDCKAAVVRLSLTLIDQRRGQEALDTVEPAFKKASSDAELMMVMCSALRLLGRLPEAIALVEQLVRSGAHQPGDLGMLLAMYLREQQLGRHIEHWKRWAGDHPEDLVAPFMVGVLLHYGNEFEESDRWLKPLWGRLEDEPRLYVYTAMNAFNLGRVKESRELLDQAASLPIVDPDVYYCRAEITRDTERELAISDLNSYLSLTEGTPHASDSKQARVREMLAGLVDCHERNLPECGGPWEHPRRPWWHPDRGYIEFIVLGMFLLAFMGFRFRGRQGSAVS